MRSTWSEQEQAMHNNSLELLAANLTVKVFLKNNPGISPCLQLDNTTAVAYIYQQHGRHIVSPIDRASKATVDVFSGQ